MLRGNQVKGLNLSYWPSVKLSSFKILALKYIVFQEKFSMLWRFSFLACCQQKETPREIFT